MVEEGQRVLGVPLQRHIIGDFPLMTRAPPEGPASDTATGGSGLQPGIWPTAGLSPSLSHPRGWELLEGGAALRLLVQVEAEGCSDHAFPPCQGPALVAAGGQ